MLKSLQINGFRGINSGKLEDLAHVNIFIGPNGCGKSTILEVLDITASGYYATDALAKNRLNRVARQRNENQIEQGWWFARRRQTPISFKLSLNNQTFEFTIQPNSPVPSVSPSLSNHPNFIPCFEYFRKLLFLDARRALEKTVEGVLWEGVFLSGAHNALAGTFESIYGIKVRSITFTKEQDLLVDVHPRPLRLDDLGAGMRIAFRILLAALSADNSALLLEEFDAYQYKTSAEKLAAALCDVADRQNVQLFMTTHSLESVHAFLAAAESKPDDWLKVFPLSLGEDGTLTTRGMPRSDAQGLLAAGMDIRDLTSYAK